jgi:ParB-like chromosome segregation protein Spo0J
MAKENGIRAAVAHVEHGLGARLQILDAMNVRRATTKRAVSMRIVG